MQEEILCKSQSLILSTMREIKLINYTINYSINNINHMRWKETYKKISFFIIFLFFREFQPIKPSEILSVELIGTHIFFLFFKWFLIIFLPLCLYTSWSMWFVSPYAMHKLILWLYISHRIIIYLVFFFWFGLNLVIKRNSKSHGLNLTISIL